MPRVWQIEATIQAGEDDYITGYRWQLTYLAHLSGKAIDRSLVDSETKPMVTLQGGYGPGVFLHWWSAETTRHRERMSILGAYYVPGNVAQQLCDSVMPVNSFRAVFDTDFGDDMGLLEDKAFFSSWSDLYEFISVADQLVVDTKGP